MNNGFSIEEAFAALSRQRTNKSPVHQLMEAMRGGIPEDMWSVVYDDLVYSGTEELVPGTHKVIAKKNAGYDYRCISTINDQDIKLWADDLTAAKEIAERRGLKWREGYSSIGFTPRSEQKIDSAHRPLYDASGNPIYEPAKTYHKYIIIYITDEDMKKKVRSTRMYGTEQQSDGLDD